MTGSRGRFCQSWRSSTTASVTRLISSGDTDTPYISSRWARTSDWLRPRGVQGDHLLIEARNPVLALLHQLRLEATVAVSRHRQLYPAAVGEGRLVSSASRARSMTAFYGFASEPSLSSRSSGSS